MKRKQAFPVALAILAACVLLAQCAQSRAYHELLTISEAMKATFAPDSREAVYELVFEQVKVRGNQAGQAGVPGQAAQPGQAAHPERTAQPGQAARTRQAAQAAQSAQPGQAAQPERTAQSRQARQAARTAQPGQAAQSRQAAQAAQAAQSAQSAQPGQAAQPERTAQPRQAAQAAQPGQLAQSKSSSRRPLPTFVARGVTNHPEAVKALVTAASLQGIAVVDSVRLLPDASLGAMTYGVTALSVATLRYKADYSSETATQLIMGMPVRLLEKEGSWTRVITPEGYIAWVTSGSVREMDKEAYERWRARPKVILTDYVAVFRQEPLPGASVVSDGVWGNIVVLTGQTPAYYEVELPQGKKAYVSKAQAQLYDVWLDQRNPTPENLIQTAMQFVGFPYQWGGTSVKAMDCSGFVKTVFYLNGVVVLRDASQQCKMGVPVDVSKGYASLQQGDLIFFGRKATAERKEAVSHVGMYIGDGRFIHSATSVRVNSLDPNSDIYYEGSPRLLKAVRLFNHIDDGSGAVSLAVHPWY